MVWEDDGVECVRMLVNLLEAPSASKTPAMKKRIGFIITLIC